MHSSGSDELGTDSDAQEMLGRNIPSPVDDSDADKNYEPAKSDAESETSSSTSRGLFLLVAFSVTSGFGRLSKLSIFS